MGHVRVGEKTRGWRVGMRMRVCWIESRGEIRGRRRAERRRKVKGTCERLTRERMVSKRER